MDAVITWADGTDPTFRAARNAALGKSIMDNHSANLGIRDDLRYCLRGLTYNCPWLRTIYIVTNDQWPSWLDETIAGQQSPPIKRISCRDIHPDNINVYGSVALEALLHKIPNLSSLFLYANSDMFICKPMKESDWIKNGVGMFKQNVKSPRYTAESEGEAWHQRFGHIEQLKLYESKFPKQSVYYMEFHQIQIMSKDAIALAETTFPELYALTIRSHGRLNVPHLGRRLFEIISIHLGVCRYDYSFRGDYRTNYNNSGVVSAPLLCVNLCDNPRSTYEQQLYDSFFTRIFPSKLSSEKGIIPIQTKPVKHIMQIQSNPRANILRLLFKKR